MPGTGHSGRGVHHFALVRQVGNPSCLEGRPLAPRAYLGQASAALTVAEAG